MALTERDREWIEATIRREISNALVRNERRDTMRGVLSRSRNRDSKTWQSQSWVGKNAAALSEVPRQKHTLSPNTRRSETSVEPVLPVTLSGQWATPLANAVTAWGGVVIAAFPLIASATSLPKPLLISHVAGMAAASLVWVADRIHFGDAVIRAKDIIEQVIDVDIDGDNHIGPRPNPVIRPIPVSGRHAVEISPPPDEIEVVLSPSDRQIGLERLADYLIWAFDHHSWTRDEAQDWGLSQKEWADVRGFVEQWGVWQTEHRPTLIRFLGSLRGYGNERTGTNETN